MNNKIVFAFFTALFSLLIISSANALISGEVYIDLECDGPCIEGEEANWNITIWNRGDKSLQVVHTEIRNKENVKLIKNEDPATIRPGQNKTYVFIEPIPRPPASGKLDYKVCPRVSTPGYLGILQEQDLCRPIVESPFIILAENFECRTDTDCSADSRCIEFSCVELKCADCQYVSNHQCISYECCSNTDCQEDMICDGHFCVTEEGDRTAVQPLQFYDVEGLSLAVYIITALIAFIGLFLGFRLLNLGRKNRKQKKTRFYQ